MLNITNNKIVKSLSAVLLIGTLTLPIASHAHKIDSTKLKPTADKTKNVKIRNLVSEVDTNNCVPIRTSPFVIVAGNGGGNMNAQCPADHPVLYDYRLQVGFGGFISVTGGGGRGYAQCCAMTAKWEDRKQQS